MPKWAGNAKVTIQGIRWFLPIYHNYLINAQNLIVSTREISYRIPSEKPRAMGCASRKVIYTGTNTIDKEESLNNQRLTKYAPLSFDFLALCPNGLQRPPFGFKAHSRKS
jgi:hypothetical protein